MFASAPALRTLAATVAAWVVVSAGAAADAEAQSACQFVEGSGDLNSITLAGGGRIAYVGTPHIRCADGVEIWADSAVAYTAQNLQHLLGGVRFLDGTRELRADEARYFSRQGRLQAYGEVYVEDLEQGSVVENGDLVYLRETNFRTEASMTFTTGPDFVRPQATLYMGDPEGDTVPAPDSLSTPIEAPQGTSSGSPYLVEGNAIFLQGRSYFRATGDVEIERDSLLAFGDSAEYDQVAGRLLLQGSARIDGETYDLEGRTITMAMPDGEIREVRALGDAVLTGRDLLLTSDEIRLYLVDGLLDRLVAVPLEPDSEAAPGDFASARRPVAVSDDLELTGDSLEVISPAEVLERLFAAGSARSFSRARDSLNVEELPDIARTDWLEGDTIVVTFEPVASDSSVTGTPPDSTRNAYRIDRIVARVDARSLYRLPPSDSTARPGIDAPAVHYVVGDEITILMTEGELDRMEVTGQTRGVYLEPLPPPEPDSLSPDSAVVADTSSVARTAPARSEQNRPRNDDAPTYASSSTEPWRRP